MPFKTTKKTLTALLIFTLVSVSAPSTAAAQSQTWANILSQFSTIQDLITSSFGRAANTQTANVISASGLVAHYPLDESSGSTATDAHGNNDGQLENGPVWVSGPVNGALSFDGIDDVVTIDHASAQDISSGYTFAAWVRHDVQSSGVRPALISKNNSGGWGTQFAIGRTSAGGNVVGGNVRMSVSHGQDEAFTGWAFPYQQWHHLAVVWDGDEADFYLNGTLEESVAMTTAPGTNTGDLSLGFGRINWSPGYFVGQMDDVYLYNRTLSSSEITNLFNEGDVAVVAESASDPVDIPDETPDTSDTADTSETSGVSGADWQYEDDFEGGFGSSSYFNWESGAYAGISSDRAYSGSESIRFRFMGNPDLSEDAWAEKRFSLDKKYKELWVRYKMWVPENYFHRNPDGPSNNKGLLMLWGNSYSGYSPTLSLHFQRKGDTGESYIYPAWRVNGNTTWNFFDLDNGLTTDGALQDAPTGITMSDRGTWIDWVVHVKTSTLPVDTNDRKNGEGNGVVQVWKNGESIMDVTNAHNYYDGSSSDPGGLGDGWNAGYLLGWANTGFDEDTFIHIDDFKIATAAAGINFDGTSNVTNDNNSNESTNENDAGNTDSASSDTSTPTQSSEADWLFEDDFEGTRDYTFWLGNGVYTNYGIQDPTNANNKVMEMRYVPNSEGSGDSWSEYDFKLGIEAAQLEMSWRQYIPQDYSHIERNHKVFALWSGPYGKSNANISVSSEAWGSDTYNGALPSLYVGVDGNNFGHTMNSNNEPIWRDGEGRWSTMRVYLELAQAPGEYGKMEIYKDGELLTSTDADTLKKGYSAAPIGAELIKYSEKGNYIDQGTLLGWANGDTGGGFEVETKFLIDNFRIAANATHDTSYTPDVSDDDASNTSNPPASNTPTPTTESNSSSDSPADSSGGGGGGGGSSSDTANMSTTQTSQPFTYRFTSSDKATRGEEGEHVRQLQKALNRLGHPIAQSGDGAPGQETPYFGPATERALQRFQAANGIVSSGSPESTGYGALGPSTRNALNAKLAQSTTPATTPTTITPEIQAQIKKILELIAVLQVLLAAQLAEENR
jgi:hypothetical protein